MTQAQGSLSASWPIRFIDVSQQSLDLKQRPWRAIQPPAATWSKLPLPSCRRDGEAKHGVHHPVAFEMKGLSPSGRLLSSESDHFAAIIEF